MSVENSLCRFIFLKNKLDCQGEIAISFRYEVANCNKLLQRGPFVFAHNVCTRSLHIYNNAYEQIHTRVHVFHGIVLMY